MELKGNSRRPKFDQYESLSQPLKTAVVGLKNAFLAHQPLMTRFATKYKRGNPADTALAAAMDFLQKGKPKAAAAAGGGS